MNYLSVSRLKIQKFFFCGAINVWEALANNTLFFFHSGLKDGVENYSVIGREALVVVFAVTRLRYVVLERKFTLHTDHKLFKVHLQSEKSDNENAINRMPFEHDVLYTSGQGIGHADAR